MSRSRSFSAAAVLAAAALLALLAGGCGFAYKEGSMQASQPKGLGAVKVHLDVCTFGYQEGESEKEKAENGKACARNTSKPGENGQAQHYVAFALPAGTVAPDSVVATGVKGGTPTETLTRNSAASSVFANWQENEAGKPTWPPPGTQIVAYRSNPVTDNIADEFQWSIDAEFTPPSPGAVFKVTTATAWQGISKESPANRPLNCTDESPITFTLCEVADAKSTGTTNLAIAPPAPATALPGGTATLTFPASLTSSVSPPPAFSLSAVTGLAGATATPATPTLAGSSAAVAVKVPANAKAGAYPVSLTAATAAGGSVSQAGTLTVVAATLKFGKVEKNKKKGTALVSVTVPSDGALTVTGKGVKKVTKQAAAAKTLKVNLKTKGPAAADLSEEGKAKVKPNFTFAPGNGAAFSKPRTVVLKLNG